MQITSNFFTTHKKPTVHTIRQSDSRGVGSTLHTGEDGDVVLFKHKPATVHQPKFSGKPPSPSLIKQVRGMSQASRQSTMEELAANGGSMELLNAILYYDQQYNDRPSGVNLDFHRKINSDKQTPLMVAIQKGCLDHARLLVTYGASPCAREDSSIVDRDSDGLTVMDYIDRVAPGLNTRQRKDFKRELKHVQKMHYSEPFEPIDNVESEIEKYRRELLEKYEPVAPRRPQSAILSDTSSSSDTDSLSDGSSVTLGSSPPKSPLRGE